MKYWLEPSLLYRRGIISEVSQISSFRFKERCRVKSLPHQKQIFLGAVTLFLLMIIGCGASATEVSPEPITPSPSRPADSTGQAPMGTVTVLQNQGGEMEGHTPRGFSGMGTGLFAGDNINSRFPDGDGVQFFLTFDLSTVPSGKVVSALLRSENSSVRGMPLKDLGPLRAEEIRYDEFTPALWDLEPLNGGGVCEFATTPDGPFRCDLAAAVQRSLDDSYPFAQFRLILEKAGDSDGTRDLVAFFIADANTNQPGIFELEITVEPDN